MAKESHAPIATAGKLGILTLAVMNVVAVVSLRGLPAEAELIDAQLIRDTCLVGTADELVERVRALEQDGLRELIFATGTRAKWGLAEDFARRVMARL